MSGLRKFLLGFAACYLVGAVSFAGSATRAMPYVTAAGDVYYGVLWPLAPMSVWLNRDLYPISPSHFMRPNQ